MTFLRKINRTIKLQKGINFIQAIELIAISFMAYFLFLLLLGAVIEIPLQVYQLSLGGLKIVLLGLFLYGIARLFAKLPPYKIAERVEKRYPNLQDRLASSVYFIGHPEVKKQAFFSLALTNALFNDTSEKTKNLKFTPALRTGKLKRWTMILLILLAAAEIFLLAFPEEFYSSYQKFVLAPKQATFKLTVYPGNCTVNKGDPLNIRAVILRETDRPVWLGVRSEGEKHWERQLMKRKSPYLFVYDLPEVSQPFQYFVQYADEKSPVYEVKVAVLPAVSRLSIHYKYPAYTGLENQTIEGDGNIRALIGTEVRLEIQTNKSVKCASMVFNSGKKKELRKIGNKEFSVDFTVIENDIYHIHLIDYEGLVNIKHFIYKIEALSDEPPEVWISEPGRDLKVTSVSEVPLCIEVEDEYGLTEVEFHYTVNQEKEQVIVYAGKHNKAICWKQLWRLEYLKLWPQDVITYYASARDNKPDGPNQGQSEIYFIEIMPFEEKYILQVGIGAGQGKRLLLNIQDVINQQKALIRETWRSKNTGLLAGVELANKQAEIRTKTEQLIEKNRKFLAEKEEALDVSIIMDLEKATHSMDNAIAQLKDARFSEGLKAEKAGLYWLCQAARELVKILQQAGATGEPTEPPPILPPQTNASETTKSKEEKFLEELKRTLSQQSQVNEKLEQGDTSRDTLNKQKTTADEIERLSRKIKTLSIVKPAEINTLFKLATQSANLTRSKIEEKDSQLALIYGKQTEESLQDLVVILEKQLAKKTHDLVETKKKVDQLIKQLKKAGTKPRKAKSISQLRLKELAGWRGLKGSQLNRLADKLKRVEKIASEPGYSREVLEETIQGLSEYLQELKQVLEEQIKLAREQAMSGKQLSREIAEQYKKLIEEYFLRISE